MLPVWSGDPEAGERAMAPLRAITTPVVDMVGPMPYLAMFEIGGEHDPGPWSSRSVFADELDLATLEAIIARYEQAPSPASMLQVRTLGGAMARVAPDATAFAHRERRLMLGAVTPWVGAPSGAEHAAWTDGTYELLRPLARGAYANFLADEGDSRVREAYPGATYERLADVKRRYDPENLFRLNQNIAPAGHAG
jgi:FAD/FMN-containing dehydrogenase